jgi:hypothetical protein
MIKRTLVVILILFISAVVMVNSQSDPKMWESLYNDAKNLSEKRDLIFKISSIVTKDFENILMNALEEEVVYPVGNAIQEKQLFEEWVYYTVISAKAISMKKGGPELQLIYQKISKDLYRGEILYKIGQTQDPAMLPWLNNVLRDVNILYRTGKFYGHDELLFGLLRGVEFFADPSSFINVFYTNVPNYSEKIRVVAKEVLLKISKQPAPLCDAFILQEQDPRLMLEAFHYSMKSESKDEQKVNTCKIALREGMYRAVIEQDKPLVSKLRNDAVFFAGALKAKDPEIVDLINKKWNLDADVNSRINDIEALQKMGTPEADKLLSGKLNEFVNLKMVGEKTGYEMEDGNRVVISLIRALGEIKSSASLGKLYKITVTSEFENILVIEAQKAIAKIEGKK